MIQYIIVQYSIIQYSIVQYSIIYSTILCYAMLYHTTKLCYTTYLDHRIIEETIMNHYKTLRSSPPLFSPFLPFALLCYSPLPRLFDNSSISICNFDIWVSHLSPWIQSSSKRVVLLLGLWLYSACLPSKKETGIESVCKERSMS